MSISYLSIYTDGASRNNPGQAAIGVVIADGEGKVLAKISKAIGVATNNQAEYMAVIAGLEKAARMGATEITINTDSELVVKQLNGLYRVKNSELKFLYEQALQIMGKFSKCSVKHVLRNHNSEADKLANLALGSK